MVMAEAAHAIDLPGRFAVSDDWSEIELAAEASTGIDAAAIYRQGYFLGDGTGAGKGRQVDRVRRLGHDDGLELRGGELAVRDDGQR
ncbi:MAG: strawberry notch-like NTP hydrolase domain-containing protein [Shimia sp.]